VSDSGAIDALLPPAMAERAEEIGVRKAALPWQTTLALGVLAGAFIGLGSLFASTVTAGAAGVVPWGLTRLVAGVAFSLGLILVVVGGAELVTGNNLLVMALLGRRLTLGRLLRNWALVYVGNLAGAVATAALVFASGQYELGHGAVGQTVLAAASAKCALGFGQAVALGVLCNALVCLAVWLTYSARSTADRILAIVPPISAFVAAGFEHSVANMFAIPLALFIEAGAPASFWQATGDSPAMYAAIGWQRFLYGNLLPVTIGNVIGGGVLVGLVYWFIYRREGGRAPLAS
jgi:formate transporter